MASWTSVVLLPLLVNHFYAAASPIQPVCEQEMVRKAFAQVQYPNQDEGPRPSQRYYNPIQEKCLTKVDEHCPEVDATCAPNSQCQARYDDGYIIRRCYCDGSETSSSNATIANWEKTYCGTRAGYGEECSDTPPYLACDPNDGLSCHNGSTCGCQDPTRMAYDVKENKCKLLAGQECYGKNVKCVDNAECIRSWDDTSSCQCTHATSNEGLCYRGYLEECSADRPCNVPMSMKCIDGLCKCKHPVHQVYEGDKCVVLVDQKCRGSEEGECVNNAECRDGVCRCAEGYSATPDRYCRPSEKSHGQDCENEECDFHKGLACVEGTCQCVDPTLKLDDDTKNCVAPIGSKCGVMDIVGKGDGKCEKKSGHEVVNTYENNSNMTCPHYYVACDKGRPCTQSATGEYVCI